MNISPKLLWSPVLPREWQRWFVEASIWQSSGTKWRRLDKKCQPAVFDRELKVICPCSTVVQWALHIFTCLTCADAAEWAKTNSANLGFYNFYSLYLIFNRRTLKWVPFSMAMLVSGPGIQMLPLHMTSIDINWLKVIWVIHQDHQDIWGHKRLDGLRWYSFISGLTNSSVSLSNLISVIFCSFVRFLRSACRCGWGQSDWHAALFWGSTCSMACIRNCVTQWGKSNGIMERALESWNETSLYFGSAKTIQRVPSIFMALQVL